MKLLVILILLIVFEMFYFKLADKLNIIDRPNERSSHKKSTIRGGGIVFIVAAIIWFILHDWTFLWGITGLMVIAVISFMDDIRGLSRNIRILAHILGITFLFLELSFISQQWYLILIAYIIAIGWLNAFNFIDGINGITALYSLISLGSFYVLAGNIDFISKDLILIVILSVLVFAFFNVRNKAVTFAGDVGSISMAFLLGTMMLALILETGRFEYIMFFAVYAADSIFTIMHRIIKGENIMKAHRSHLYQIMANEYGIPHVSVSVIYASIQLIINVGAIYMINTGIMTMSRFIFFSMILSLVYILTRIMLIRKSQGVTLTS